MGYASDMEIEGEDGIFMKIARHEVPAFVLFEDEKTIAFLDTKPNTEGHALVIPKQPFRNVFSIDQESFAAVMETVRRIAPVVRDAVGAKGVHINSNHEPEAGQEVFHLHIHIIPRHDRGEFEFPWPKNELDPADAEALAAKIRAKLS